MALQSRRPRRGRIIRPNGIGNLPGHYVAAELRAEIIALAARFDELATAWRRLLWTLGGLSGAALAFLFRV